MSELLSVESYLLLSCLCQRTQADRVSVSIEECVTMNSRERDDMSGCGVAWPSEGGQIQCTWLGADDHVGGAASFTGKTMG
jgi:hypothetical protein